MSILETARRINPFNRGETIRSKSLTVHYDKMLRYAPYSVHLESELLQPLFSNIQCKTLAIGNYSNATINIDALGGIDKYGNRYPVGSMDSKEYYDPLLINIHFGQIYEGYLKLINEKNVEKKCAQEIITRNISLTLIHEACHYYFKQNSAVLPILWQIHSESLNKAKEILIDHGFPDDEEEVACEAIADWTVNEDSRWENIAKFSPR